MQSKSNVLLRVLLNKYHPGPPQSFLKCLPQDEIKEVAAVDTPSNDITPALTWPRDIILHTHYSWIAPIIEKMPKNLQLPVVASLPEPQNTGVGKLLNLAVLPPPPATMQSFMLTQLYKAWNPSDALPRAYLPKSSLEALLTLSKTDMVDLIDLMAMFDLSDAIRHIVDKMLLKKIYQCLSPQKQQFLRLSLHKKEKLAAPKLDIGKWDGSLEQFNSILHRRGMLRFGKALCGQSRAFLWHVVHILDSGRGNAVAVHYLENEIPGITPLLAQQLLSVINFLKSKN